MYYAGVHAGTTKRMNRHVQRQYSLSNYFDHTSNVSLQYLVKYLYKKNSNNPNHIV